MMKFKNPSTAKKEAGVSYLGSINSSAKMIKNKKVSNNYTYIIYLSPAKTSGYNVCTHSTPECRLGCLANSGRAKVEEYAHRSMIKDARIKKTRLFFENQDYFMAWMVAEMKAYQMKAKKDGYAFSVRLNGTADIDWADKSEFGTTIFEIFPDVQFYDYTKNPHKFVNKPENYHLTFSYTGRNWDTCKGLLDAGFNVAVIFDTTKKEQLPATFNGYEVINGDLTDYRPYDGKGVIVGLRYKECAHKNINKQLMDSCFVVKTVKELVEAE
jgi:hypothetical protein